MTTSLLATYRGALYRSSIVDYHFKVFKRWQQDLRLENGQGTDAKLCWHIFATLWWIFSSVSGWIFCNNPSDGRSQLKPRLQPFDTVLTWDSELPIWVLLQSSGEIPCRYIFRRNFIEEWHVEWATCSTMNSSAGLRAFSIMGQHGSLCEPKMKSKSFHTPEIPPFASFCTFACQQESSNAFRNQII